uniref:Cadherin domain-containing protein n=1 Tax=Schistocephalus solidus TaxID=70667 RepID=A0A183SDB8_SCHSO
LTAIALLDREVASRHTIQVIAIDGERDPSLSDELGQGNHGFTKSQRKDVVNTAIVTVQIYVEDLNDNTPTFVYPNGASNMQKQTQIKIMESMMQQCSLHISDTESSGKQFTSVDAVAVCITAFICDADSGVTFDAWFKRWEDIFHVELLKANDARKKCHKRGHKEDYCPVDQTSKSRICNKKMKRPKCSSVPSGQKSNFIRTALKTELEAQRKYVTGIINGKPVGIQLDTASDIMLSSKRTLHMIVRPPIITSKKKALKVSGGNLRLTSELECVVSLDCIKFEETCFINSYLNLNLLHLDWIKKHSLLESPLNCVCNSVQSPRLSPAKSNQLPAKLIKLSHHQGKNTLIVEAADQGTPPGKITSTIFVMVDDSEPIGLHNGMLLDEEADKARIADGSERDYLSSKIFNVEADQLVTMCMVIGLSLVVLSLLVTAVFFFHNRRSNLKRHMRRRLRHPVQCIQNGIQLPRGRQETRHGLAGGRNTCQLKVCEGDLFDGVPGYEDKPNQNDNDTSLNRQSSTNRNKVPSKVEEPYTIRFSALQQRSPPSDGHGTKKIFRSHAIFPPTLAYIFSNPPASSPISDCEKGDVLQRFGSPDMDTPSTVDQKIKTELNQPTVQVPVHTTIGNMFTLPIRAESLFQSEIWCNSTLTRRTDTNPNSSSLTTFSAERKVSEAASEASVQEQPKVLDPLHLLEGPFDCAKNQHFTAFCEKPQQLSSTSCQQPTGNPKETYVEVLLPFGHCFDSTAVGALGRMPISTPASKIRSDSDSKPQNQEPNLLHSPISVLDPITGKRIFVPPFSKSNTPLSKSGSKLQRSGTIPDNGERSCNEPKEDGGSNNDRAS